MNAATEYPFVYRFNTPAGLKGQRCHRTSKPPPIRTKTGQVIWASGAQIVTVEFVDGRVENVSRSAIVDATSKLGRRTVARVGRGDVRPPRDRRRRATERRG
jgi:hypothetical protein